MNPPQIEGTLENLIGYIQNLEGQEITLMQENEALNAQLDFWDGLMISLRYKTNYNKTS
jgi:hypothetical protein